MLNHPEPLDAHPRNPYRLGALAGRRWVEELADFDQLDCLADEIGHARPSLFRSGFWDAAIGAIRELETASYTMTEPVAADKV